MRPGERRDDVVTGSGWFERQTKFTIGAYTKVGLAGSRAAGEEGQGANRGRRQPASQEAGGEDRSEGQAARSRSPTT